MTTDPDPILTPPAPCDRTWLHLPHVWRETVTVMVDGWRGELRPVWHDCPGVAPKEGW